MLASLPRMKTEHFIVSTLDFFRVFFMKNFFFSKIWVAKLGVRLICECGLSASLYGIPFTHVYDPFRLTSFAYYCTLLFVVCYITMYLKVRCVRHPQRHGAAGVRERKLTSILFLVTFGSLMTFLPMMVFRGFEASNPKLFQRVIFSCSNGKNDICGFQLTYKSYNRRHTDARGNNSHNRNNFPQCFKPFKYNRYPTSKSLIELILPLDPS